jgi:GT2 family glycosyltransferase
VANRAERRRAERAAARGKDLAASPAKVAYSDGKGKVMIGVPCGGHPSASFLRSMVFLMVWDAKHNGVVVDGGSYMQKHGSNVSQNRNQLVKTFLEGGWEWLWFIDDDMTFEPDILDRLLEVADEKERPIVGALCFSYHQGSDREVVPTIYQIGEKDGEKKLLSAIGYPHDQLVQVHATGTGCLLVHRRVFVELAKRWQAPWPWFDWSEWGHTFSEWGTIPGTDVEYAGPGDHIGEDITFCLRAGSQGGNVPGYDGNGETFPVFVDTRIECGHRKSVTIDQGEYARRHPFQQGLPPTFVVVPVKGEHHYTESLLRQLAAQKGYAGIFVYDNGADTDPYTGYVPDQCEVIPAAGKSIHEMWNLGVRAAMRQFSVANVAILNNDLDLGPKFLEGLGQALRSHDDLWVVSPNYDGRTFETDIQAVRGIAAGREDGTGGMAGFAFMVKGELFDRGLPLFDEQYELWYGDTDFALTVENLGGLIGIVRDTTVVHIDGGSKTAGDGKKRLKSPELQAMADRDRVRFEEKWQLRTVPV